MSTTPSHSEDRTNTGKRTVNNRSPIEGSENKKYKLDESEIYSSSTSTSTTLDMDQEEGTTKLDGTKEEPKEVEIVLPDDNASISEWGKLFFASMNKVNLKIDKLNKKIDDELATKQKTTEVVYTIHKSVEVLIQENNYLKSENSDLKERLIKLEYHTRRNNLRLDGIPEVNGQETDTDCYNKVMNELSKLFEDDLDANEPTRVVKSSLEKAKDMTINRIHRYGTYIKGRNRSIIFNLQWFGDREYIINNRKHLNQGIFVNEDFPPEIEERRRVLRPILKMALGKPHYRGKASLRYDKLIINGKPFTAANLAELPGDLTPSNSCEKTSGNMVLFMGMHTPFSNFYRSSFKVDGINYNCSEQYFQSKKAEMFDDDATHYKIMKSTNPIEIKRLGNRVNNYIHQQWEQRQYEVMLKGVTHKFCSDENLMSKLSQTKDMDIVEATYDRIWGCGFPLSHYQVDNREA